MAGEGMAQLFIGWISLLLDYFWYYYFNISGRQGETKSVIGMIKFVMLG